MTEKIFLWSAARICVCLGSLVVASGSALAADYVLPAAAQPAPVASPSPYGILSEVRGGLMAHAIYGPEYGSVDVNGEVLFVKPYVSDNWLLNYFIPRFHLGGNLNTAGKTSDVYGGVTWSFPLYKQIFGELTFGGSYNDGFTGPTPPAGRNAVGCDVMFRESATLGYHLTEHWNLMAYLEHISNAGTCAHNAGVTNAGGRIGYVF